jgi:hypothetical protein
MILKFLTTGAAITVLFAYSDSITSATATTQFTSSIAVLFIVKLVGFNDYCDKLKSPGTFGTGTAARLLTAKPLAMLNILLRMHLS